MNSLTPIKVHALISKKPESEHGETSSPDEIINELNPMHLRDNIQRTNSVNDCTSLLFKAQLKGENSKDTEI